MQTGILDVMNRTHNLADLVPLVSYIRTKCQEFPLQFAIILDKMKSAFDFPLKGVASLIKIGRGRTFQK